MLMGFSSIHAVEPVPATSFAGGDGTKDNPWQISNFEELHYFSTYASGKQEYFALTANIDASVTKDFAYPQIDLFIGHLNGRGFEIDSFYSALGFINLMSLKDITITIGTDAVDIINLGFTNVEIVGPTESSPINNNIGTIVHFLEEGGLVENCFVTGSVSGRHYIGGLVGRSRATSQIKNCYCVGEITNLDGSIDTGNSGGIVGNCIGLTHFTNCFFSGKAARVIGKNDRGASPVACYYDAGSEYYVEATDPIEATALDAGEMALATSYSGWNFLTVWEINEAGYPVLRNYQANTHTGNVYFVSNDGNDNNSGDISSPLKNIQTAINKMANGDIVYLHGGVYRETVTVNKSNLKILAYPGETPIIKGSDLMSGWIAEGNYWKLPTKLINVQQVFVDGNNPIQQIGYPRESFVTDDPTRKRYEMPVGTGIGDMAPGRFWWDGDKGNNDATGYLYIWLEDSSDPNSHIIEVSQRRRVLWFLDGREIYVKGVQIEHSNANTFSEQSPAVQLGDYCVLDGCIVQWCDFSGVSMGYLRQGAKVINSQLLHNGALGANASGSSEFVISNTRMAYNNYRNFYSQWHAGGFKGATDAYGTIENCEIDNNNGAGVWYDNCYKSERDDDEDGDNLYPIIVRNNYFHNNGTGTYDTKTINNNASILIEVSEQAYVYNNIIDTFEYRGIWVSSAWFSYFTNNVLTNGKSKSSYVIDGGASYVDWAWVKHNVIANNILYNNNTTYDIRMMPDDGGKKYFDNICQNNLIYNTERSVQMRYGGSTKRSIEEWKNSTPFGDYSISTDPLFADTQYHLSNNSPCVNTGYNFEDDIIAEDYLGNPRKLGPFTDMGVYEEIFGGTDEYNATLENLEVSQGLLEPTFVQTNFIYTDTLPDNTTQTPVVTAIPYNSGSVVSITNAINVQATDEADRTTTVTVTSESDVVEYTYKIIFYSNNTTGIDDVVGSSFKLYPNPSNGVIYIDIKEFYNEVRIEVLNMDGVVVKTKTIEVPGSREEISLDGLNTEMYFIRIQSGDKVYTSKVLLVD